MDTKSQRRNNGNQERVEASNFLSFMRRPNFIGTILQQHTQIIEESEIDYYLKMKTEHSDSQGPLRSLLCLPKNTHEADSDFFTVDGYNVKNKFLCTRNPKQDGVYQFWSMAFKKNIHIIVMLSPIDNLMRHRYWSTGEDSVFECREFRIETLHVNVEALYTTTTLLLKHKNSAVRKIVHFNYTGWPMDNISHHPKEFIRFIMTVNSAREEVDKLSTQNLHAPTPIMVHCSDGFNNSCVYCLLDICISEFGATNKVSLPNTFLKIRQQNRNAISQPENYVYCYQALYVWISSISNSLRN
ncbi:tyrosine-protein phosphatase non-receptor type 9-like [Microplitis mediator]|uniref:Uncharacterized protein n=1 Tax=Microplitis mediator bracovirus TaxID=1836595 RepID=A0A1D5APE6_9VIRU|nr:tyrosine-protein phosphatase non-receptor type 9-like [Microplitis mediator]AOH69088.1 hypothetical protein A6F54_13 [Microplitis mediator bracovirus]